MGNVKTAISLEHALLQQADALARDLEISRSRLFALALEDYINRHENKKLLERINAAYSDAPDEREKVWLREAASQYSYIVEGEW